MKVWVVDTSVVVAGVLGAGSSAGLVRAFFADELRFAFTPAVLTEYAEVLERAELGIAPTERISILLKLRASGVPVEPARVPRASWPDPDDLPFVAAALATDARIIVTLNPRDFAPARRFGVRILSPAEAVAELKR